MTKEEYESLREVEPRIYLHDLKDLSSSTLIYGYTCDRTFEIFVDYDGFSLWRDNKLVVDGDESILAEWCVPDKRVYPEQSDYEFCKLLKQRGVFIPFTTFRD